MTTIDIKLKQQIYQTIGNGLQNASNYERECQIFDKQLSLWTLRTIRHQLIKVLNGQLRQYQQVLPIENANIKQLLRTLNHNLKHVLQRPTRELAMVNYSVVKNSNQLLSDLMYQIHNLCDNTELDTVDLDMKAVVQDPVNQFVANINLHEVTMNAH